MIILNSIKVHYDPQLKINKLVKKRVDTLIKERKKPHWHYFSRLKTIESYALKIETGRFLVDQLEDFFACTIVVKNNDEINTARRSISNFFNECRVKPKSVDFTHKEPDSFEFDDLRLYGKLKNDPKLPYSPMHDILFEIQIKTFLQHAWILATHDRIYKSKKNDWGEMRIAYQIKAMLENIELSINQIDNNKKSILVKKTNNTLIRYKKIEKILKYWDDSLLPNKKIRIMLIQNIDQLLKNINMTPEDVELILKNEKDCGRGDKKHLTPYFGILQSIIYQNKSKIENFLENNKNYKSKLVFPREIDFKFPYTNTNQKILKID